ncbi:hypothetical protein [Klebsiella quasipneumoniae]|uniref:hypothetical protein n=1 Tax=Klebsiella quasipneumoniae TaxID=1463165 RepID=UPI00389074E4
MASATLIRLNKDEWQKLPAGHFYNGKYQIGPFTLTYEFIVKYMTLIHKTEIPESRLPITVPVLMNAEFCTWKLAIF